MKKILLFAFMACTLFACKKKEPADYLTASGGKWNFSDVVTSKKNGVLQSSNTVTGTMAFSNNGSLVINFGGTDYAATWTATSSNLTITAAGDITVNTITESTNTSQKFFYEESTTTSGVTITNGESFTLTK